jgi:glycosyltransferase involved in cell wall biosynthesis
MHVAINGWFWDKPNAGSGQYIRRLLPALKRVEPNLEITLIMPPHNPEPDNVPEGVQIIPTGSKKALSKFGKVWFEQRTFPQAAARSGADLAHVPYWGSPLSASLPMVVSVLDMIPVLYPIYATGFFNRLYISLVSTSARNADHIITISQTSKLDIEKLLHRQFDDISVTYLAPDTHFNPRMGAERDGAVREKYDLPDQFVLGGLGFDVRKQVNELLLAYTYVGEAEGENIPLVLAGREPDWTNPLFPDLREYAKRLNIERYVRWIGYVDEADKPALYRLADVFVFPSEYEGFGLPPLEAMACGTPVVAWDSVVADEVLEDSAYLVDNARDMAGAIIALLLQKPLRDTMINQGLAQTTKYTWRKTAQGTLEAYEKTLQKSKRSS